MMCPPEFLANNGNATFSPSPDAVNYTCIRNFKGLEADVVFVLDTHKMEDGDYRTAYAKASRARVLLFTGRFNEGVYTSVGGLCKDVTQKEIEAKDLETKPS